MLPPCDTYRTRHVQPLPCTLIASTTVYVTVTFPKLNHKVVSQGWKTVSKSASSRWASAAVRSWDTSSNNLSCSGEGIPVVAFVAIHGIIRKGGRATKMREAARMNTTIRNWCGHRIEAKRLRIMLMTMTRTMACPKKWTDGWMDERMDGWMGGWMHADRL